MNQNKWMPFNSLFNGNEEKKKLGDNFKKNKPILSDEQLEGIENKIIEAFTEQIPVTIIHFKKYDYMETNGFITKINSVKKNITIDNNETIYFINIIDILIKN